VVRGAFSRSHRRVAPGVLVSMYPGTHPRLRSWMRPCGVWNTLHSTVRQTAGPTVEPAPGHAPQALQHAAHDSPVEKNTEEKKVVAETREQAGVRRRRQRTMHDLLRQKFKKIDMGHGRTGPSASQSSWYCTKSQGKYVDDARVAAHLEARFEALDQGGDGGVSLAVHGQRGAWGAPRGVGGGGGRGGGW
jgi:hypothetical protein